LPRCSRRDHPRVLADLWRDLGRDAHRHAKFAAQVFGDHPLVRRVGVRVDETHTDGFDIASRNEAVIASRSAVDGDSTTSPRVGALAISTTRSRDRWAGELDLQVVHVVAMLVADQHRVGEAHGCNHTGTTDPSFDQRIGDERRGVDDGAVMSAGRTPALTSSCRTPARTPSSGAAAW